MKFTVRKVKTPSTPPPPSNNQLLGRLLTPRRLDFGAAESPITPRIPTLGQLLDENPSPAPRTPRRSAAVLSFLEEKKLDKPRTRRTKCGSRHLNPKPIMHFIQKMNQCTARHGMNAFYQKPSCTKGQKKQGHCRIVYKKNDVFKTRKAK